MDAAKRAAGRQATEFISNGMIVGLGTGSTVWYVLERLAERIENERLQIRGIATSVDTEEKSKALGIPIMSLDDAEAIDLTIDGADEADPHFNLIKGLGGALLREKVAASVSREMVIVVDRNKLVDRLGAKTPVPVEVLPFAVGPVTRRLSALGAAPVLRRSASGAPFRTDNGNRIIDAKFTEIKAPLELEDAIRRIIGVIECGLFVNLAHRIVVGNADGTVEILKRLR